VKNILIMGCCNEQEEKTMYRCPVCGGTAAFRQTATVENIISKNGFLVQQRVIKENKKMTCELCGHSGHEKLFETAESEE
jgi:hypothetical protein